MSEQRTTDYDKPTKAIYGREVHFQLDGEEVQIACFACEDGGFSWEFKRNGRAYPLRLSKMGMDAMIALYHEMLWRAPPAQPESEAPVLTHPEYAGSSTTYVSTTDPEPQSEGNTILVPVGDSVTLG